ncbi:unnamed protein product [Spodoptera littoralis]|uniref:Uncharacterized protein n=1 Tax=Spodoptera littoralis TaxID=7109 RepID=A0A9P0IM63_SPOLI|nr:unnamed protein product [Spodoptera littoralis]CAH1647528.1 unnamed protein product [Spodoptera littoralis]
MLLYTTNYALLVVRVAYYALRTTFYGDIRLEHFAVKAYRVARSTDGSGLDGGCEDDVSRLTPGLHPETTFDMNDLPSNTYTLDTRRMQLYSHPHVHPTLAVMMTLSSPAPRYRNTELVLSKMSSSPSVTSPTLFV